MLLILLHYLIFPSFTNSASCCTTCLDTYATSNVDSVDWNQCSVAKQPCCFDCGTFSEPTPLIDSQLSPVVYQSGKATIPSGNYVYIPWQDVDTVRYMQLNQGQNRTSQVTSTNPKAELNGDNYMFCASAPGIIYYRAFKGNCSASPEASILVTVGNSTGCKKGVLGNSTAKNNNLTVNIDKNKTPSADSASTSANETCNLVRGSINAQGKCVCASDWAGPPNCSNLPLWKWIVTIGGGVAAMMSIAVSAHAFLKRRKKKRLDELNTDDDETVETLQITPGSAGYFKQPPTSTVGMLGDRPSSIGSEAMRPTLSLKQECTL